jgi:hypothetical protein
MCASQISRQSRQVPGLREITIVASCTLSLCLLLSSSSVAIVGCTSTTEGTGVFGAPPPPQAEPPPPSPCANILGNWKIKATRTDGDCDKSKFKSTEYDITLRRETPSDRVVIVLPGFGGCPGDFDQATCKLVANCDVMSEGKTVGSAGLDWTFNNDTLTGSEISRALPPLSENPCNVNYSDEGTKL